MPVSASLEEESTLVQARSEREGLTMAAGASLATRMAGGGPRSDAKRGRTHLHAASKVAGGRVGGGAGDVLQQRRHPRSQQRLPVPPTTINRIAIASGHRSAGYM